MPLSQNDIEFQLSQRRIEVERLEVQVKQLNLKITEDKNKIIEINQELEDLKILVNQLIFPART